MASDEHVVLLGAHLQTRAAETHTNTPTLTPLIACAAVPDQHQGRAQIARPRQQPQRLQHPKRASRGQVQQRACPVRRGDTHATRERRRTQHIGGIG